MAIKVKGRLNSYGLTDKGFVRSNNEDYFAIDKKNEVYVVADGMGGARGGEVASKLTVDTILNYLDKHIGDEESFTEKIADAIQAANNNVMDQALMNVRLNGMGCTLVMAVLESPNILHLANIGDARCYLFRRQKLSFITHDHSVVGDLVRKGDLSQEEARTHFLRNIVTHAVGTETKMNPYQRALALNKGDIVLLCSDGLWDMLPDKKIERILSGEKDPEELCRRLIDSANDAGGEDNTTVIIISIEEDLRSE
jgi:protein phosphatase